MTLIPQRSDPNIRNSKIVPSDCSHDNLVFMAG